MSRSDLSADVVALPVPGHPHDEGATRQAVERAPGGTGRSAELRVGQAREARRRADALRWAAQEAARMSRLAREEARAMDERAALLRAQLRARCERRQVTADDGTRR